MKFQKDANGTCYQSMSSKKNQMLQENLAVSPGLGESNLRDSWVYLGVVPPCGDWHRWGVCNQGVAILVRVGMV